MINSSDVPTQNCPTILISDRPSLSDSFESNRAYSRIVSAIIDIVRSPDNEGMSIGVEGSWGAGKSTLINLLRTRLNALNTNEPTIGVGPVSLIAFDAWAHEDDPLRLTFLETIVDGLKTEEWINKNHWTEQLDIISQRKEIKDSASDYGLTGFDVLIAFSFFLIPIGIALLSAAFRDGITLDGESLLGISLCIAAPVLILAKLAFQEIRSTGSKFKNWWTQTPNDTSELKSQSTKQTFLALLLNRTLSAGRTVVVKSPEPTSLEFEKQFQQLMSEALDKYPERRVILVIDNLDRVQPGRAVEIWSTLQTFLQYRYYKPPTWLRQLYTIVLYDPSKISERSATAKAPKLVDDLLGAPEPQPPEKQAEGSILDKSFQIRLEVPPPILSDWRGYLLKLLATALPNHKPSEHHEVYRILAIERYEQPPTIRELKLFVNQICALHLQWQDSFPLKHLAYYVRVKHRYENLVKKLISGHVPEPQYAGVLDEGARDSLAALSFNVERELAYQFLLAAPIKDALMDSTGEKLKELATKFESGFWEALENIVSTEWAGDESEKVGLGALAIERSGLLQTTQRPECQSVRDSLSKIAIGINVWRPFNVEIAEGLAVICRWRNVYGPNRDYLKRDAGHLLETVTEGLFDPNNFTRANVAVPDWLAALNVLVERIRELGFSDVGLTITVNKIRYRLDNSERLEAGEISRLLEVLVELHATESSASKALSALIEGGNIYNWFNQVLGSSKDFDAGSWCILALLGFAPSISPPPNIGYATHGYNALIQLFKTPDVAIVQAFSKLLLRYKDTLAPNIMRKELNAADFLAGCFKHIASTSDCESFFTPHFILSNWNQLKSKIDDYVNPSVLGNPRFIEEVQRKGFSAQYVHLYSLMVKTETSESSVFRNWCRANLEELTLAEWNSDLNGHSGLASLASTIRKTGVPLELGENFQNAIVASVEDILQEKNESDFALLFDNSFLLDLLGNEARHTVCTQIYEVVKQVKGEFPDSFLASYGKLILEVLTLDSQSVALFFKPLIERRNEANIKWLTRVLHEKPSLLEVNWDSEWLSLALLDESFVSEDHSNRDSLIDFKRTVLAAASRPEDSATPFILILARMIGFHDLKDPLPPPPWTVKNLGESLYKLIAKEGGYFDPALDLPEYQPALGPDGIQES